MLIKKKLVIVNNDMMAKQIAELLHNKDMTFMIVSREESGIEVIDMDFDDEYKKEEEKVVEERGRERP